MAETSSLRLHTPIPQRPPERHSSSMTFGSNEVCCLHTDQRTRTGVVVIVDRGWRMHFADSDGALSGSCMMFCIQPEAGICTSIGWL